MKRLAIIIMLCVSFLTAYSESLTKENLWKELLVEHIKYPKLVFAQALVESGDLKSKLCKFNNNLFGMRYPENRKTYACGSRRGYAKYQSWKKSVMDYALYQQAVICRIGLGERVYRYHIGNTYSRTIDYLKQLDHRLKDNRKVTTKEYFYDLDKVYCFNPDSFIYLNNKKDNLNKFIYLN